MILAIINGIITSIILETIILLKQNFSLKQAFKTAVGMSLISMVSMEIAMNATDYFLKAQRKFPNSKNAPIYLHNRARILDNILEDKNNARLAFEELIELYPNHKLSINAQLYLDNAFGKSDQE